MEDFFSAFPAPRDGMQALKVVTEQYHKTTDADRIDREVHADERDYMYHQLTTPRLKGLRNKVLRAEVCMYTVTPDDHFVIDFHPDSKRVVIASPCSGHGFKHSPAVGETLVQLALNGQANSIFRHLSWRACKLFKNDGHLTYICERSHLERDS